MLADIALYFAIGEDYVHWYGTTNKDNNEVWAKETGIYKTCSTAAESQAPTSTSSLNCVCFMVAHHSVSLPNSFHYNSVLLKKRNKAFNFASHKFLVLWASQHESINVILQIINRNPLIIILQLCLPIAVTKISSSPILSRSHLSS